MNAFRDGHWFSYVFLVDQYDPATNSMGWTVGGFQGGEGSSSAAEWNVENVFEELDYPREWYFDTATNDLYYFHNDTAGTSPPDDLAFSGTHLEQLITIIGAGSARSDTGAHVENITIRGLSITGAALTTLAPHGQYTKFLLDTAPIFSLTGRSWMGSAAALLRACMQPTSGIR